ncbi:Synaptotagmin-like protein 2 [Ranunculus cassubicifolius]
MEASTICANLPSHLSSFVDTFVDFSVSGGLFLLPPPPITNPPPSSLPSPHRLVAIGDLHGDLTKSKQALRIAGLIDDSDRWTGENTTLVQVGDVLDRGGDEIKILYFLEKLKREALRCGGSVVTMIGNHEVMNVDGDFRFVAPSALSEFKNWADWFQIGVSMKTLCAGCPVPSNIFQGIPNSFPRIRKDFHQGFRARVAALRPNGPISTRFLSGNSTVLVVGESVFVHGGLLEEHVNYGLDRINEEMKDWINGLKGRFSPGFARGKNSMVWLRNFSDKVCDCASLQHVLATIPGAKRMIMGHTIQETGINGVCDNSAIRIDVGMSKGCGNGYPEVLEIIGNSRLRILTTKPVPVLQRNSSKQNVGLGVLLPEQPRQIQVEA